MLKRLSGRVVRAGTPWSVIKFSGPSTLIIWGKFTDEAAVVEVFYRCTGMK